MISILASLFLEHTVYYAFHIIPVPGTGDAFLMSHTRVLCQDVADTSSARQAEFIEWKSYTPASKACIAEILCCFTLKVLV